MRPTVSRPADVGTYATEHLRFIRNTMAGATAFTAVPGLGAMAMGVLALGAAWIAEHQRSQGAWLATWIGTAALACTIGVWAMLRKATRLAMPVLVTPGRRFFISYSAPMLAAAILTPPLYVRDGIRLLPGLWLLLYGTAMVTGGAFSIKAIPLGGVGFMLLGGLALVAPPGLGDWFMAAGFGLLHLILGFYVARKHGG